MLICHKHYAVMQKPKNRLHFILQNIIFFLSYVLTDALFLSCTYKYVVDL